MTITTVIPLLTEPVADDQYVANFAARARVNLLEVNPMMEAVNDVATEINASAAVIADSEIAAVSAANFKGSWSVLTGALAMPASVAHDDEVWALLENLANVTTEEPGISAKWLLLRESADRVVYGATTVAAALTAQQAEIDAAEADITAAEAATAALIATGLGAFKNRLINGSGSVNQRGLTTVADDAYFVDRWYALTESGSVTVAQLTDPETGATFGFRLTQPDVTAKRMGFAQIIESQNIRQYASQVMTLSARLKMSVAGNIRFAVIEHTGTADVVTSDVVNNWSSTTYTPSNFFIAGINIIDTGVIAPGAGVFGSLTDTATLGASVKNVIVFVWTESAVAQNSTLEANRVQYERGSQATPFEWRMNEAVLCRLYAESKNVRWRYDTSHTTTTGMFYTDHYQTKRAAPSASILTNTSTAINSVAAFSLNSTCTTWTFLVDAVGPVERNLNFTVLYAAEL